MDVTKFYILFYQMTELIPLFSYLERLNAFRLTTASFGSSTPGEEKGKRVRFSMSRNRLSEENKEGDFAPLKVEVITKDEMQTPKSDSIGECSICLDALSDLMLPCLHCFCNQCITLWQTKQ